MSALVLENDVHAAEQMNDTDLLAHVDEVIASSTDALDAVAGTPAARAADDRHVSLAGLCHKFHAIIVGRAAEVLLEDVDALPAEAGLYAAPSWAWVHSRVNVGRKERAADGSRLRLPIRVDWSHGPVFLIAPGAEQSLTWAAAGLGHTGSDAVPVSATLGMYEARVVERPTGVPTAVTLPLLDRVEIVRELQAMVAAGQAARWETLAYLEPYITKALHAAHSNVANELSLQWGDHQTLLDETKLEAIRNRMLLGDDDHPGKVSQLLDRCLRPDTFRKVEPLKYIKEALRVDANTEIRNALGDPHIGPKIRKVARETGLHDIDALVEEYRRRYPKDRLSKDRAMAALSVAPDAMASWWGLQSFSG